MNSEYNWAAKVLLWEMTNVGRLSLDMTLARVKVFPEPVTPRSVRYFFPEETDSTSCSMALGWSPQGWNWETSLKYFKAEIYSFYRVGQFAYGNQVYADGGDVF